MQNMMAPLLKGESVQKGQGQGPTGGTKNSESVSTIYKHAIQPAATSTNRGSSSGEELIDTSDETMQIDFDESAGTDNLPHTSQFDFDQGIFVDQGRRQRGDQPDSDSEPLQTRRQLPINQGASTSSYHPPQQRNQGANNYETPEQRADRMIREAETSKARMLDVSGRGQFVDSSPVNNQIAQSFVPRNTFNSQVVVPYNNGWQSKLVHSMMVDESFMLVAAHISDNLRLRIEEGQYVDFARLLPQDRVVDEEDNHMVMLQEGNQCFYVPASERERTSGISSFTRWEQAFRVYADIYT